MLLWAAVQLVPKAFVRIFTSDAALVNFTAPVLRIYLGGLFLFGIQIACQMTFTSLGKAVNSIVVAVVRNPAIIIKKGEKNLSFFTSSAGGATVSWQSAAAGSSLSGGTSLHTDCTPIYLCPF